VKKFTILILSAVFMITSLTSVTAAKERSLTDYNLIAHAMGGINGKTYTNSYEAFIANYAKGFKVFEVDLQLTSDGYLVARHDWDNKELYKLYQQDVPENKLGKPLKLAEFKKLMIHKTYHALDISEIFSLMSKYPDMYLVTDTKDIDNDIIINQFKTLVRKAKQVDSNVLKRIVPQIYNQQMYRLIEDIHPFDSYIYTLYASTDTDQQVIEFVKGKTKVKAVTMSEFRVNPDIVSALNMNDVKSYVHTINDSDLYDKYKAIGVFGIYTDTISEKDLELAELKKRIPSSS